MHDIRFPGEDATYRDARNDLLVAKSPLERILAFTRDSRGCRCCPPTTATARASIAVAVLLSAVCAYAQGGGPLPDRTPPPRWERFTADRFSAAMPGKPVFKTQTLTAKNGHPVQYSSYTVDLGRSAYMASYSDYDAETKISLDGAIEGVLSSWKDPQNLVRNRTTLYGYPAQVIDFTSEDYRVVVRAFVVGRRLYQLGFVEMRDDYAPAHAARFMKSFTLR